MQQWANLLVLPVVATICCVLLVPLGKRLAWKLGAVDMPGGRRAHSRPIPRLGGVAIFCSFVVSLCIAWFATRPLVSAHAVNPMGVIAFAVSAVLVFLLGVADDVRGVRPRNKLAIQTVAALIVVLVGGCRIRGLSVPGGVWDVGWLSIPLTIFWIVFITNAVNLLDGLDGLAAGVVAIALVTIIAITNGRESAAAVVSLLILGSCVGFLFFNSHPASVFMGDSGSLFLGFSLGVLSTYTSSKAAAGAVTIVPVLVVALPLTDTLWTIARRYIRGLVPISLRAHMAALARIFIPDRLHIHHRLIDAGLSQRQAVYALYALQAVACGAALYIAMRVVDLGSATAEPPSLANPMSLQDARRH